MADTDNKTKLLCIKGCTIYMILYNYGDYDYSVITLMTKLDDAYKYICEQEYQEGVFEKFKMIQLNNVKDLQSNLADGHINICYILDNYMKFNLHKYIGISNYIIIPMKIE